MKILLASIVILLFFNADYSGGAIYGQRDDSSKQRFDLKEETKFLNIGATTIKIVASKNTKTDSAYLYFNMHDNENTSVEATKKIIARFGGTLLELQSVGERLINFSLDKTAYTFDPNRIFTENGIGETLKFHSKNTPVARREIKRFADKLMDDYFKDLKLLIAVHNNTDENYSIKSYQKGGEYETDAKLVYVNPELDEDDFFYVTEEKFFNFFKDKKFSVVLQDNKKVVDDGSLAVYCADKKISYINVESEHNHLREQEKMLEALQDLLKQEEKKTVRISSLNPNGLESDNSEIFEII